MIDSCKAVQHLFVAVPAYTGQVSYETVAALVPALLALQKAEVKITMKVRAGNCYVDHARNQLIGDFLESGASDALLVDADVGFLGQTLLQMCMATKPIVAAIYPKKTDTESWPVEFFPGTRQADDEGLLEVAMVPTGMLRINRAVFEELSTPAFGYKRYRDDSCDRELVAFYESDIRERYYGEDVDFCRRWREAGGRLRIVPDATLCHFGMKSWTGNLGEAMKAGRI